MNLGVNDDDRGGRIECGHVISSFLWLAIDIWWSYLLVHCFRTEYVHDSAWAPDYISVVLLAVIVLRCVFTVERIVRLAYTAMLLNSVVGNYAASTQPFWWLKKISRVSTIAFYLFCVMLIPIFVPFTDRNCHGLYCACFFGRVYSFYACCLVVNWVLLGAVALRLFYQSLTNGGRPRAREHAAELHTALHRQRMEIDVSSFPVVHSDSATCPICLEEGSDGNPTFSHLECGHRLHQSCLRAMIDGPSGAAGQASAALFLCPVCRQPLCGGLIQDHHVAAEAEADVEAGGGPADRHAGDSGAPCDDQAAPSLAHKESVESVESVSAAGDVAGADSSRVGGIQASGEVGVELGDVEVGVGRVGGIQASGEVGVEFGDVEVGVGRVGGIQASGEVGVELGDVEVGVGRVGGIQASDEVGVELGEVEVGVGSVERQVL
jgi:hypothetical protein